MKTELIVKRTLVASHSLDTNEQPHAHLFKFEFTFAGEPIRGRIVDLPALERALESLLQPLQNRYLNDLSLLPETARTFPTCETLGAAFFEWIGTKIIPGIRADNPSISLASVLVTLFDIDGREWGAARVSP